MSNLINDYKFKIETKSMMNSVDIPINDIDYESLFGGFETLSNNTV
jgi:hypothetical protein